MLVASASEDPLFVGRRNRSFSSVQLLSADPAWDGIERDIGAAAAMVREYRSYGMSRGSAGWVAEDLLRRVLDQVEQIIEQYVSSARTRLGRVWRRRQTRELLHQLHEALRIAERMQAWGQRISLPAFFGSSSHVTLSAN
ncbi:hypothetical protein [Streptomyces sp. NPDC054865]